MKEWFEQWMCPIEDYNCPYCNANAECMMNSSECIMDSPQDECEDIIIDPGDKKSP